MNATGKRKDEHISINLEKDVRSHRTPGFENYLFIHQPLPELDLNKVKTNTVFLGREISLPLMISSMTGGTERGDRINLVLAEAAQAAGIAMGVGSQRALLEKGTSSSQSNLRVAAPRIPLYANIGAVQLNYGFSVSDCQRAIDLIQADALILHLNPLQEALQPEGQVNFSGLTEKIEQVCRYTNVPVIVKEVGWGINLQTAQLLVNLGVSAIDVAGAGGTSWSEVEKYRSKSEAFYRIAARFRDWGNPTAECVREVREGLPEVTLIASGGITGGMDLAKAIALGANIGGMAGSFLRAADESIGAVLSLIDEVSRELRITMFAAGAADIDSLQKIRLTQRMK